MPNDEWRALQEELVQEPAWIIDGNYFSTFDVRLWACDTVAWLDLPVWVCLASVLWRVLKSLGKVRSDMGSGCPEKLDWKFLRYIAAYRRRGRPLTLRTLSELPPSKRIVQLTSRRAVGRWLEHLEQSTEVDSHQGGTTWHSS